MADFCKCPPCILLKNELCRAVFDAFQVLSEQGGGVGASLCFFGVQRER